MSTASKKNTILKIDRGALHEAQKKAREPGNRGLSGGLAGGLIVFTVILAAGVLLYVFRDLDEPSQNVALLTASGMDVISPTPATDGTLAGVSSPHAEQVTSTESVLERTGNAFSSSQKSVIATDTLPEEERQARIDHLAPEWIQPSTRKVYMKIGRLDGHPENAMVPFDGEFGKETVSGTVVQIYADRVHEEFPQRLLPGQSVVLHLPELEAENLMFRAVSVRRDDPGVMPDSAADEPMLRILCNGNAIWGRRLGRQGFTINALIPMSYLEAYKNTVTLQNTGKVAVVFDALWIESAHELSQPVEFFIRDWERIPNAYKRQFEWVQERENKQLPHVPSMLYQLLDYPAKTFEEGLRGKTGLSDSCEGIWQYRNFFVIFHEQEKVALSFLERALGWYFHGGSALTIEHVTGPGRFFCPYTKRLYPSAFALWSFSRVFEGEARRLPLNVLAGGGDAWPLELVYWMATENQPGEASIIIARSRHGCIPGGKVRVVCALPWQGATVAHIYNGVFPDVVNLDKPTYRGEFSADGKRLDDPDGVYDRNRVDKIEHIQLAPNGPGGLLDVEWDIQDCLYVRLKERGVPEMARPAANQAVSSKALNEPVTVRVVGGVSELRESSLLRRKQLPVYLGVLQELCANYRVKIGDATRGTIEGQVYVVPEDAQSLFCKIDYTEGRPQTAEGAVLSLYTFHEAIKSKTLSFWVFPHTKKTSGTVMLHMGLGVWKGRATLKPGRWQRVELQFADIANEPERYLVLLGPQDYDKPGREDTITFEFNGISLLDPAGSGSRYMDVRPLADGKLAIVVLGLPGKEGDARHSFSKAVAVKTITNTNGREAGSAFKWSYRKASQMLVLSRFQFPESAEESVFNYLNATEKELCRQKGLTPIVMIADIRL